MTVTATTSFHDNEMLKLRRHISALASLPISDAPVLSAYFDVRTSPEAMESALKIWAIAAKHQLPAKQRTLFRQSKEELVMMLRQKWPESIRSLAVFSRVGQHPFLMVLPFEAVIETQFYCDDRPVIFPLVQLKDRFHRFVLAICTEETSRVMELNLGTIREDIHLHKSVANIELDRHESREKIMHRRAEDARRFAREEAHVIGDLMARQSLSHLIIAGQPRSISAVRDQLPKHLLSSIVDALPHAPNGHDCSSLIEEAIKAFVEAEKKESRRAVEKIQDLVRSKGLAVVGMHACRDAIFAGAVAQLVIAEELHPTEREELVRLATLRDLPIEVCENDSLLLSLGGVGCMLRFRMEYLPADGIDA